jgi:two-component system chemotaxis response regulator CheB
MVVDDSAVIRGLLTRFLEADPEISVVASVSNGQMAIDKLDRTDAEIVVLDIEMPVMDGMTALPLILRKKPGIQVLMASTLTRKNAEVSLRALSLGAADYVPKPSSTSEIHSADSFKIELTGKIKAIVEACRGGRARAPRPATAGPAAPTRKPPLSSTAPISLRKQSIRCPDLIAIGSSRFWPAISRRRRTRPAPKPKTVSGSGPAASISRPATITWSPRRLKAATLSV